MTVFISHNWAHHKYGMALVKVLRKEGIKAWIDEEKIEPGDDLPGEIVKGIDSAEIFLALITKEYESSKYCKKELNLAFDKNKCIIPLHIENKKDLKENSSVSFHTCGLLYLDFFRGNENYDNPETFWTGHEEFHRLLHKLRKGNGVGEDCGKTKKRKHVTPNETGDQEEGIEKRLKEKNYVIINGDNNIVLNNVNLEPVVKECVPSSSSSYEGGYSLSFDDTKFTSFQQASAIDNERDLNIGGVILKVGPKIFEKIPGTENIRQIRIIVLGEGDHVIRAVVTGSKRDPLIKKKKSWKIYGVLAYGGTLYIGDFSKFSACQKLFVSPSGIDEAKKIDVVNLAKEMKISEFLKEDNYLLGHIMCTFVKEERRDRQKGMQCLYMRVKDLEEEVTIVVKLWAHLATSQFIEGAKLRITYLRKQTSHMKELGEILVNSPRTEVIMLD